MSVTPTAILGVAKTSNVIPISQDPSIIPGGVSLPPLVFRAQRVAQATEATFNFNSVKAVQLMSLAPGLQSLRYARTVFFYGIKGTSGTPALPVANVANAFWGYSPLTLVNQIVPWAGLYGQWIQPVDGQVIDLQSIWVCGAVGDGLVISAL